MVHTELDGSPAQEARQPGAGLQRVSHMAPYLLVLAVAGYLFYLTFHFDSPPQDGIGPEFWPRIICAFMLITCAAKLLHIGFNAGDAESHEALSLDQSEILVARDESGRRRRDVWLGIATTALYLLAFRTLGYFLSTFLYMIVFIYLGRYRKPGRILAVSAVASLVFMFIFMKVVYISLPLGVEPFAQVSEFLLHLMHVR